MSDVLATSLTKAAAAELTAITSAWWSLARRWDLSPAEIVAILPLHHDHDHLPDVDTETRMRLLLVVGSRVVFPTLEDERDWVRGPKPRYGWLAPLDLMSDGVFNIRRLIAHVEREFG